MAIEFSCHECGKELRTSDDKAGRRAKCPDCGTTIEVPSVNTDGVDLFADGQAAARSHNPRVSLKNCPMCGFAVSPTDTECSACGEPLSTDERERRQREDGEPRAFDLGVVISRSWTLYKENLGIVVGSQLVASLLGLAAMLPGVGLLIAALVMVEEAGNDQMPLIIGLGGFGAVCLLIGGLVATWIQVGAATILLGVTRSEPVTMGMLFAGTRFLWRAILCSIIFQVMYNIGQQMCFVPSILVALFFWPYLCILIDEDAPNVQALLNAPKICSKSALASIALFFVYLGVILAGALALGIGLLFTMPLGQLMWYVAYDEIRGGKLEEDSPSETSEAYSPA